MKARAFLTLRMVCVPTIALLLLVLLASPSEAGDKQVKKRPTAPQSSRTVLESQGLTYVYETMNLDKAMIERHDFYSNPGQITISEGASGKDTIYQEKYTLVPGCSRFPTISKYPTKADVECDSFVVLCGSSGGRHETIKAFIRGAAGLDIKTASLDFQDSFPNLAYDDRHGFYTAKAYRRMLVDGVGYEFKAYATVYRLLIDNFIFSFIPVFGAPVEQFYSGYYQELKDEIMQRKAASANNGGYDDDAPSFGDYCGPMLAALVATENAGKICSEMGVFESFGLTLQDLQAWRKRLVNIGYPDFNFDSCREVTK